MWHPCNLDSGGSCRNDALIKQYWVSLNKRHQSPIGLQGVARRKLRLDRLLTLSVLRHSMNTGKIGLFDNKKHSNIRPFHLIILIV